MKRTSPTRKPTDRQRLQDWRSFVDDQLPPAAAKQFDPRTESASLSGLALLLFLQRYWLKAPTVDRHRIRRWLLQSADVELAQILDWSFSLAESSPSRRQLKGALTWCLRGDQDIAERLIGRVNPDARKQLGFYCTPQPLAQFVIERAHRAVVSGLGVSHGLLADELSGTLAGQPLNILEPAVGTGVFLSALVRLARRKYERLAGGKRSSRNWSRWLVERFLPRLYACDIQLGPLACAHVRLASELLRSGFDFASPIDLRMRRLDFLSTIESDDRPRAINRRAYQASQFFRETSFPVIVGNPPYGAIQATATPAMNDLMHGRYPGIGGDADYFCSADGKIAERKTWLYDWYVQFIRLAQLRVEQAGGGVVAFLTNRGLLNHVTMRGLRYQWLRAFDRVEIHDFQGGTDRSASEFTELSENVFGVRSGIALSVLTKSDPSRRSATQSIELVIHRGAASQKLSNLRGVNRGSRVVRRVVPPAPLFQFRPFAKTIRPRRWDAISLDECFARKSSAIVTARDALVVGFNECELLERMTRFRDLNLSDRSICLRYLRRQRGRKYTRGSTRGWNLKEARATLAAEDDWQSFVRRCSYRPLDDRAIYWHPRMIDWPRAVVSETMIGGKFPALIARRQSPRENTTGYFWLTRWPTVDGIIRSDNRGNETVFPMCQDQDATICNLADEFVNRAEAALKLQFESTPVERFDKPIDDRRIAYGRLLRGDLFAYLVALVFSTSYRRMFALAMEHQFTPILLPRREDAFRRIVRHGHALVRMVAWFEQSRPSRTVVPPADLAPRIETPTWTDGRIEVGNEVVAENVSSCVWEYRAGSHQICRKWLCDRRGRPLTAIVKRQYQRVCRTVSSIVQECQAIEKTADEFGGWQSYAR